MTERTRLANGIQGRHVLAGLAGFFGLMLLANAIFVYFAVATFSGGDTSKPYQKGLRYNQTIAADARQAERAWQAEVGYSESSGMLQLSLRDKMGAPVKELRVAAKLSRPATDREDRRVVLKEASAGVYATRVDLAPGVWVISIVSRQAGEGRADAHQLKRRLLVEASP
jgi:nitrogen fixation protein FixH